MQYIIVGILTIVFLPFINTQHDDKIILRIYLLCLATFLYCELINYLLSLYYNIPIIFSRTLPQISNEYDFPIYLIKYIVGTLSYKISLSKKRISGLNFVYSIIISISLTITFALTFSADIFIDHYPFYESEKLIINIKNIYKI
ncbi:hypothetical protein KC799_00805, partial [candidate division KSB1 bacterium]|nr:hypothetical protein [candidate division KSB1 bacterium]